MTPIVTHVKYPNRKGCQLFGILHEPEERRHDPVIILLSPGIKSRVAPHRLYVKMTKRFCAMGFVVLRVDPEGLGESEGEIEEFLAADVYGSMELGRLVNDTIDAMDWMQSKKGYSRFILSGLCGGAITGLLTGAIDKRVESILGIGMTCVVSGSKIDHSKYITKGQLDSLRNKYLRKIFDPASIIRLLTLRTDYRLLSKSMIRPLECWLKRWSPKTAEGADEAIAQAGKPSNLNPHFPKALLSFVQDRKMLLIFSGQDRLYWEFEEKFMSIYQKSVAAFSKNLSIYIVKDANHILSFSEWQKEMINAACSWLTKHNQKEIRE